MEKLPKLSKLDQIKTIAVLGHSNKGDKITDPMTFDAITRCRAAGVLFKKIKAKKIILLGGGNDRVAKVAEGERMRKYLADNFKIADNAMEIEVEGVNSLTDILQVFKMKPTGNGIVFITSDYNVVRIKLILEILGKEDAPVFSSERILLQEDDQLSRHAIKYLESKEYQKRLLYEAYWIAKTICDSSYTAEVRKELGIKKIPIKYYKKVPRREMENIDI